MYFEIVILETNERKNTFDDKKRRRRKKNSKTRTTHIKLYSEIRVKYI